MQNNIGRGVDDGDMQSLRDEGIEVDNEDAAPENAAPPTEAELVQAVNQVGEWIKPTICLRKADNNIMDTEGRGVEKLQMESDSSDDGARSF